jgi:uncharacterized protein YegL
MLPLVAAVPPAAAQGEPSPYVTVDAVSVEVEAANHYATTRVSTTVTNHANTTQEHTFRIATSESAFVSRFAITVDNRTYESHLADPAAAQREYERATSAGQAAGLIAERFTALRLVHVSLPPESEVTAHFTYEELLRRTLGVFTYQFPLVELAGPWRLGSVSLVGEVTGQTDIASWNTTLGQTWRVDGSSFGFSFVQESLVPSEGVEVSWVEDARTGQGLLVGHPTPDGVAFVHTFAADGLGLTDAPLAKDIVFVIDVSGSMRDMKIRQAKEAFTAVLGDLRAQDRFGVVSFSTETATMDGGLLVANATNVAYAKQHVATFVALGGTNIDGGLSAALQPLHGASVRAPIIVLLTDGQANAGVSDPDQIRANLQARNTMAAAVFTIGFGSDADELLLKQIAVENGGEYRRVYEGQDAADQIAGFYDTFGTPLLTNVTITYLPAPLWADPTHVQTAYAGSDLVVTGLLPNGTQDALVRVEATSARGAVSVEMAYGPPLDDGGVAAERAVAYARLRALEDLALVGVEGARENATAIAMRYGFVSTYTSLVVVAPEEFAASPAVPAMVSGGQGLRATAFSSAAPTSFGGPPYSTSTGASTGTAGAQDPLLSNSAPAPAPAGGASPTDATGRPTSNTYHEPVSPVLAGAGPDRHLGQLVETDEAGAYAPAPAPVLQPPRAPGTVDLPFLVFGALPLVGAVLVGGYLGTRALEARVVRNRRIERLWRQRGAPPDREP